MSNNYQKQPPLWQAEDIVQNIAQSCDNNEFLNPLPDNPKIQKCEISLQINTGNIIHEEFDNLEDLLAFVQEYSHDPAKILERIKPKRRPKQ